MLKKIILIIFGIVIGLIICEIIISVTGLAPQIARLPLGRFRLSKNPVIGYEPVPNFEYFGKSLFYFEFRGRSNNLGFRDRNHNIKKADATYRIIVLGDSITMGLKIEKDGDVFTSVLERSLNEIGKNVDVEVINFGVSGYNTQQEVGILIEKGLVFKPDLVLLQYCLNDRTVMNGGIIETLKKIEKESDVIEQSRINPFLVRSALYRLLYQRIFSKWLIKKRENGYKKLARDTVEENFRLLRSLADKNDFKVLVVVFPAIIKKTWLSHQEYGRIAEFSKSNHFFHLDLRENFVKCSYLSEGPSLRDVWHPTMLGHHCAGRAIAEFIVNSGLL